MAAWHEEALAEICQGFPALVKELRELPNRKEARRKLLERLVGIKGLAYSILDESPAKEAAEAFASATKIVSEPTPARSPSGMMRALIDEPKKI